MKKEKKESPIGVLWGWGKSYHGKFISSIILAVLGVTLSLIHILFKKRNKCNSRATGSL